MSTGTEENAKNDDSFNITFLRTRTRNTNTVIIRIRSRSKVKFPFSWRHLGERGLARYTLLWVRCSSPFLSLEPVGEASLKLWTRG